MNGNFNKEIDDISDRNILFNIGKYYSKININYDLMKKCYLMLKLKSANKEDECMVCYENKKCIIHVVIDIIFVLNVLLNYLKRNVLCVVNKN